MKYIDRLLQGAPVEWYPLGEVAEIKRGKRLVKSELNAYGDYAVYQNSMTPLGYYHKSNVDEDTSFIISAGSAGEIGYSTNKFWAADDVYYFLGSTDLSSKYLYYYLLTKQPQIKGHVRRASVPRLSRKAFEKLPIPIPPVAVQEEVVRVLDKFTALEAELEAELDCRKRQYRYYRDALLTFDLSPSDGLCHSPLFPAPFAVEWRSLGEVGEICMCKRILKEQTSESGEIPFYKIGTFGGVANSYISRELFTEYRSKYRYPKVGDILISASGTIGRTVVFDGTDAYFQDSNIVWIDNDERLVTNRFLYYYYQVIQWSVAKGGTIQRLYNDAIKKAPIPIPPLAVQERIVEILDKFDTLVNSISEGLPREIELRRKQYEYYRDALLSF